MKNTGHLTRRRFAGGLLPSALLAAVAPDFIPFRLLAGDNTPSKKIQLGHIGVGGQGTSLPQNFTEPIVKGYRGENWKTNGTTFFGTKGWVSLSRGNYAASNPEWFKLNPGEGSKPVRYHAKYYQAFVESVRSRTPSVAPVADALRSDALSHLSLMAITTADKVV